MMKITKFRAIVSFTIGLALGFFILTDKIFAQQPPPLKPPAEDNTWWYLTLFVLVAGLAGAIFWKIKNKPPTKEELQKINKNSKKEKNSEGLSFDADAEIEWLRKNQNVVDRKRKKAPKQINLPKTNEVLNGGQINGSKSGQYSFEDLESVPLPVFNFHKVESSKPFNQLPLSNDEALLSAIEQTYDEYEEDEEVRELAVRILAVFRTRNSIESLSQVAIYDLSSSLRSKAVLILTEFDHESVFETILLACADPTREVRAAAARGLTRLSFDRADAWTRIMEINEEGRLRHAARAAIEGGFIERSFDRIIHRDSKYAYEAFVLLSLIVKSGEVDSLMKVIDTHKDPKVRSAVLHVLKVSKDPLVLSYLYNLIESQNLSVEQREEIDKILAEMNLVAA